MTAEREGSCQGLARKRRDGDYQDFMMSSGEF